MTGRLIGSKHYDVRQMGVISSFIKGLKDALHFIYRNPIEAAIRLWEQFEAQQYYGEAPLLCNAEPFFANWSLSTLCACFSLWQTRDVYNWDLALSREQWKKSLDMRAAVHELLPPSERKRDPRNLDYNLYCTGDFCDNGAATKYTGLFDQRKLRIARQRLTLLHKLVDRIDEVMVLRRTSPLREPRMYEEHASDLQEYPTDDDFEGACALARQRGPLAHPSSMG
jgi:hypothetical protein